MDIPSSNSRTHPKFVRFAVLIGIVIVLNLFFFVVRALIVPEPQYEDFCPTRPVMAETEESCVAEDGEWIPTPIVTDPSGLKSPGGYCDFYAKCQQPYEDARDQFQLYAFVITVGFGILALIVGVLPLGSSIVSSGLSYGGVLAFIVASVHYWNDAGSWVRLSIAVIALIALLYIGIKRFKD